MNLDLTAALNLARRRPDKPPSTSEDNHRAPCLPEEPSATGRSNTEAQRRLWVETDCSERNRPLKSEAHQMLPGPWLNSSKTNQSVQTGRVLLGHPTRLCCVLAKELQLVASHDGASLLGH